MVNRCSSTSLQQRAALVTGAGRGIGRGIAEVLARRGADVAVAARTRDEIEQVATACRRHGVRAEAVVLDVADSMSWERAIEQATNRLGPIDILVNNAGVATRQLVWEATPEHLRYLLQTNLVSALRGIKLVLPAMLDSGWGRVINISSISARSGQWMQGCYAASKSGMDRLTQVVAAELREAGARQVTCNAIRPGGTATPLVANLHPEADLSGLLTCEQVGDVCAWLASDAAGGISGELFDLTNYPGAQAARRPAASGPSPSGH